MEQEKCSICFDAIANCIVVPCGHKCGCETCLKKIQESTNRSQKKCPICRGAIRSIVKVINSGIQDENTNANTNSTEEEEEPSSPLLESIKVTSFDAYEDEDEDPVTLEVLPIQIQKNEGNAVVRVGVSEPEDGSLVRQPVDISVVIDISGSMGKEATYEVDGQVRSDGLSILNVCQHAIKVIIACLKEEDRFSLVAFDQSAEIKFPLTHLTKKAKEKAHKAASSLKERGQTNIFAGITKGMNTLRLAKKDVNNPKRNAFCILLTDGVPTTSPKKGHVAAFKNYCKKHNFECQLSCFGFGYGLDSKLMVNMSQAGGGTFSFIPTAPVVGTVFINALSSILSTYTTHSKLIVKRNSKVTTSFPKIPDNLQGGLSIVKKKDNQEESMIIDLGPLLCGQSREIVIPMKFIKEIQDKEEYLDVTLEYGNEKKKIMKAKGNKIASNNEQNIETVVANLRTKVVDTLRKVVEDGDNWKLKEAQKKLKILEKELEKAKDKNDDERVEGLYKDISGRATKSLDGSPRFNRWGKHYIRALLRAYAIQQCTNKLDFGIQVYGGSLFGLLRQHGDAIFLSLPAPAAPRPTCPLCGRQFSKEAIQTHTNICMGGSVRRTSGNRPSTNTSNTSSSCSSSSSSSSTYTPPAPAPRVSMQTYTTQYGGCFGPESIVNVVSKDKVHSVRIADIKKDDFVQVYGNENGKKKVAKVICVVKAKREDPKPLVKIPNGPSLTSKHPVRIEGEWKMPGTLGYTNIPTGKDKMVYNFVLEPKNAILLVNGYQTVTFGHGLKGKVVEHGFYGSEKVINEVKKLDGWKDGLVTVSKIIKDLEGHAVGFK